MDEEQQEQCSQCGTYGNFQLGACPTCVAEKEQELGLKSSYDDYDHRTEW